MKTIVTAYGTFPTGTELADAVTQYGLALARQHAVDVVDVPFFTPSGVVERVQLRVGWLSDMATVTGDDSRGELLEDDTLLTLINRTDLLEGRRGLAFAKEDIEHFRSAERSWDDII